MAGKLNAIVISPMGHKPMGEEHEDATDSPDDDETGGDECKIAFDDLADSLGIPDKDRDGAYEAARRFVEMVIDKSESAPHDEGGKEEGY